MAYKITLSYQGTYNTIIEGDCAKEEAIAQAIDRFEEINPGLLILDHYAERLWNKGEADPEICQENK